MSLMESAGAFHRTSYNVSNPSMTLTPEQICWDGLFPQASANHDASDFAALHAGRNILVTGAGGSIGSALAKTIHRFHPRCLVLIDSSEQGLYRIHSDLLDVGSQRHVPVLGSVTDERCLNDAFQRYCPEIVYHAAAFKHVPLTEMNPFAVVQNNVFGTSTLAGIAQTFDVEKCIMISTDKAVNPESIMGASKRLAELVLLGMPASATRMASIRLGNVLGSEGSVVPLFLEQIAHGGPVTVTDPEVERYFLTMEETVHRVLSTAASSAGEGAIAIPVMGDPVRIADLARYLVEQTSAKGVEITYTGLRPGDKLHEQFVSHRESVVIGAPVDGVQWIDSPAASEAELAAGLAELSAALDEMNLSKLLHVITRLVAEYEPSTFLLQQAGVPAAQ
jgi:FlaA1/EpsC-like NDP-sugar epimerase